MLSERWPTEGETVDRLRNEPVLVLEVVRSSILAAVAFGLPLTPEQSTVVLVLASALVSLIARERVSPYEPASESVDL
jgi:hypothetical protein